MTHISSVFKKTKRSFPAADHNTVVSVVLEELQGQVNERDEFIQKMINVLHEVAPAAAKGLAEEAPKQMRYES